MFKHDTSDIKTRNCHILTVFLAQINIKKKPFNE